MANIIFPVDLIKDPWEYSILIMRRKGDIS